MILLHASILYDTTILWAEDKIAAQSKPWTRTGKSPAANGINNRHPFAAHYNQLLEIVEALSPAQEASADRARPVQVWLPTAKNVPLPSSAILAAEDLQREKSTQLIPWTVFGIPIRPRELAHLFEKATSSHVLWPGVLLSDEFRFLSQILLFAHSLVIRQQYLPGVSASDFSYFAKWDPLLLKDDRARLSEFAKLMPPVLRAMRIKGVSQTSAQFQPGPLLSRYTAALVDDLVRESIRPDAGKKRSNRPQSYYSAHDCWLASLKSSSGQMTFDTFELEQFARQVVEWQQPVIAMQTAPFRLCFRLDEPAITDTGDVAQPISQTNNQSRWNVTYLLQDVNDQSLLIPVRDAWKQNNSTRTMFADHNFKPREYLLLSLGQASRLCQDIADSLRTALPCGFSLNSRGAFDFLSQKASHLEQAGFGVMLPAWWKKGGTQSRLKVKARVQSPTLRAKAGLTMDKIIEFDWQVALGDVPLTLAQLKAIAEMKAPLVNLRGQWVHVSADDIATAIDFLERKAHGSATVRDLLKYSLGLASPFAGTVSVEAHGWIQDLLEKLAEPAKIEALPLPDGFSGELRPYQKRGFSWLAFLSRWGLGACLADDMGLGKTVQTLAMIQAQRRQGERLPVLLICPTSVVNNWRKEAQRFTPDLSLVVHHGGTRTKGDKFREQVDNHAIVVSTYSLLYRDFEQLSSLDWAGVILDEAQYIKNPATKHALAARQLKCKYRIALTGTPVENSVADLWSIMEFLNPGLLGNQNSFRRNYFYPIQVERDTEARDQLKRMTQPFILRRLKTDKTIITDLPEKQEMKVYCSLTKEQVTLYGAVLKDLETKLEDAEGMERRGLILATLSKLKQVCNHPAHFLADNSELAGRSGKLERLGEILEEVSTVGEKALIFSQFTEMGELIKQHCESKMGEEVLFLHGGINKTRRDEMVERFQDPRGPSLFMLSLKAGGTGLNLTGANHVIHFDRWWNPAVENQASDRAFRIGQTKNVQIRKFICAGTLEEKIDNLIESKRQLAEDVVGSGEAWLTELSNAELRQVFALSREARVD